MTYAILTYGDILNPKIWRTLEVPISSIKQLTANAGYHKIQVKWNNGYNYDIDMFNTVEFK